jgi:hypothetical protein
MSSTFSIWKSKGITLLKGNKDSKVILNTFCRILDYAEVNNWQGACHAITSIFYVLLMEQNVDCDIYIGEASLNGIAFNHSWIEIDNKVYDIAIRLTLIDGLEFSPVINGIDLITGQPTEFNYGIDSGMDDDPGAHLAKTLPFAEYMENAPMHPDGLWGITKELANLLGIKFNMDQANEKYKNVARKSK